MAKDVITDLSLAAPPAAPLDMPTQVLELQPAPARIPDPLRPPLLRAADLGT